MPIRIAAEDRPEIPALRKEGVQMQKQTEEIQKETEKETDSGNRFSAGPRKSVPGILSWPLLPAAAEKQRLPAPLWRPFRKKGLQ